MIKTLTDIERELSEIRAAMAQASLDGEREEYNNLWRKYRELIKDSNRTAA